MSQISNAEELLCNLDKLPNHVIEDINKRISDWISSGGSIEDDYIKRQYRYAEEVANSDLNTQNKAK